MTFSNKVIAGISGFSVGLVLSIAGYVAGAEQSDSSLNGIFILITLLPATSALLMIIPFLFYKLDEKTHQDIVNKLEDRHAE